MRTMECVLAVATLATIWIGTVAADPETALKNFLEKHYAGEKRQPAYLVNVARTGGVKYQKANKSDKTVVDLLLKEMPAIREGAQPHEFCKSDIGIEVIGIERACKPLSISLEIYKDDKNEKIKRFIVQFQASEEESLIKLYIPVFEIPPKYQGKESVVLAGKEKVGVISPFTREELKAAGEGETASTYYGWLNELLRSYGLYRLEKLSPKELSAWTRPLVLNAEFIKEFTKVWEDELFK